MCMKREGRRDINESQYFILTVISQIFTDVCSTTFNGTLTPHDLIYRMEETTEMPVCSNLRSGLTVTKLLY